MQLKKPLFFLSLILMAIVVLSEAGGQLLPAVSDQTSANALKTLDVSPPGCGIPYLGLFDGLVLFTVSLIAFSLIVPEKVQARTQGIVTFIFSLLVLIAAISFLCITIAKLFLMIGLLFAPIFGTIAYGILYGSFNTSASRVLLSYTMLLKIGFAGLLLFSHYKFLENKGLMLIIVSSLVAGVIVSLLHGIVPSFLVSITDSIAGIVVLIIALVWAVFFLIGSVKSIVKAVH